MVPWVADPTCVKDRRGEGRGAHCVLWEGVSRRGVRPRGSGDGREVESIRRGYGS